MKPRKASRRSGFTLVEMLVATAVLTLLLVLVTQLLNATTTVTAMGTKHMDADAASRALFDRMAIDIGAMVRRSDVDYYLKGRPTTNRQAGNDQIAFYSQVAGYYPSSGSQSPVSLVAYRLNADNTPNNPDLYKVQRLGKGLVWNGVSATDTPVVFLPVPLASPLPSPLPSPAPATSPAPAWPQAANMAADTDYEQIGPAIYRFEYYYVLKGHSYADSSGKPSTLDSILSDTPWDTRAPLAHTSVNGLQDVAAIGVVIAVIDSKTRVIVSDTQLKSLSDSMIDFEAGTMKPGDLEARWQAAITASSIPQLARSALRIYGRTFYLDTPR